MIVITFFSNKFVIISYTRYARAFCHVGLPSTLDTAFCTTSKNIQQNGASSVTTKRPAHICQIPAIIHKGDKLRQHQKPKNIATERKIRCFYQNFDCSILSHFPKLTVQQVLQLMGSAETLWCFRQIQWNSFRPYLILFSVFCCCY